MNTPDRIRYYFQHAQDYSVITIMRMDWEKLVRADGSPTQLEELPSKIAGVAKQAEVVAIAASGIANPSPDLDVVRKDVDDDPYIYNTDHYTVVENFPKHALYSDILKKVGATDSSELKSTLESWVWLVGPKRVDGVHWSKEIPEYIRNAKKKPQSGNPGDPC